jgi:hypothetical protein
LFRTLAHARQAQTIMLIFDPESVAIVTQFQTKLF